MSGFREKYEQYLQSVADHEANERAEAELHRASSWLVRGKVEVDGQSVKVIGPWRPDVLRSTFKLRRPEHHNYPVVFGNPEHIDDFFGLMGESELKI